MKKWPVKTRHNQIKHTHKGTLRVIRVWWGILFFYECDFLLCNMCVKLKSFFKSSSVFFWVPFRKITNICTVAPARGIGTKMINVNCCIETHMNRHYIFVSSSYGTILITHCATLPGKHLKKRSHRWYTRMALENKSSDTKWMTSSVAMSVVKPAGCNTHHK